MVSIMFCLDIATEPSGAVASIWGYPWELPTLYVDYEYGVFFLLYIFQCNYVHFLNDVI